MIHYVTTAAHAYTMQRFLADWGATLASRIRPWTWEALRPREKLPGGAWILADLERLGRGRLALAAQIATQLEGQPGFRVLNHPGRWLDRYALLDARWRRGASPFRAVRASDGRPERFPQFVRCNHDHDGPRTGLLTSAAQVDEAVAIAVLNGFAPEELLVVEFCDVSAPDGTFRKRSVFRVGDRYVPRHLIFSRQWMQKVPDRLEPADLAEERDWFETVPELDDVRAAFDEAGCDYGRIDYGVKDEKIVVWEINTNPIVMLARAQYLPEHLPRQERFLPLALAAFEALDAGLPPGSVRLSLTAPGAAGTAR